eukprot:801282-Amphidinium_carterae.1
MAQLDLEPQAEPATDKAFNAKSFSARACCQLACISLQLLAYHQEQPHQRAHALSIKEQTKPFAPTPCADANLSRALQETTLFS